MDGVTTTQVALSAREFPSASKSTGQEQGISAAKCPASTKSDHL